MKLKTFTFLKHKTYIFSVAVLVLGSILFAKPAYSQVDYYYGLNKKGVRVGLGVGTSILKSNWSASTPGYSGVLTLDYDFNPYASIGIQGTFGTLNGNDAENKLYFSKDAVIYAGGSLGFKVGIGQFANFRTTNGLQEALKRIYVGAGIGEVFSQASLTPHSDGQGLPYLVVDNLAYGKTGTSVKLKSSGKFEGPGIYPFVPINVGTYIMLRGFLGNDKVELNPNFQYNFVLSPLFDGYQPNSQEIPSNTNIGVSGNQFYYVISLGIRYKF